VIDRVAEREEFEGAPEPAKASVDVALMPTSAARADVLRFARGPSSGSLLLGLQESAGNRAVGAILQRCGCGGTCGCQTRYPADDVDEDRMLSRAVLDVRERLGVRTLHRDDDEGGPVALDSPPAGAGTGGGGAPAPVFNHSGSTVTVNADNAIDFSNNITAQIGTPHTEIELEPDIQWDVNGGVKKITSVGLTVTTKIVKVRFGMGRPNANHKKAIDEMVAAIKAHEEAHRAIIVAAATDGLAKAHKFVGTSKIKEAWKALDTGVTCVAAKKHEDLDAKEGLLTASEDGNGNVTVSKSASGAKYPCPPAKIMPTG
jgi:Bacterial protein of unknown function (DUF922)